MGTYLTTTTMDTRMVGVTFDTATTALAVECISDAEAEVNKYLSKRYDLSSATFQTYTSIPPLVRSLATRYAVGCMWKHLSRGSKESLSRGATIAKDVVENLKLISNYKADLFNTAGSVITDFSNTSYRILSSTDDYSTTFNEDDPLNWKVDSDKLDDIESERD